MLPSRLILFITTKCDLRCKHCFFSNSLNNQDPDLTAEDIKRIIDNYPTGLEHVIITGGEPFLNKDLTAIVCNVKAKSVNIPTNGNNPGLILAKTEEILKKAKGVGRIGISVSLDGPEDVHDRIRGRQYSYRNALNALAGLKKLEKEYPKLSTGSGTTLSKLNIECLREMADFKWNTLGEKFSFQMARSIEYSNLPAHLREKIGSAQDCSAMPSDFPETVMNKFDTIKEIYFKNLLSRNIRSKSNIVKDLLNYFKSMSLLKAYLATIKERKRILPCYAGYSIGVIYSNLDVSFCEFMKPIGNLKEYDFSLHKIWHSKKADELRKVVSRCFCTHTCFVSFGKYDLRKLTYWARKI